MARPGVEYEQIERVARKLLSQGQHPSVQKVRNALGTGSNSTIAKHLRTWQESFQAENTLQLPESVPEDLLTPLDDFWSLAVQKAEANYQAYKADLDAQLAQAKAERELAGQEVTDLRAQVEGVRAALADTEALRDELKLRLATLDGENGALRESLAQAQQQNEQTLALLHAQADKFYQDKADLIQKQEETLTFELERAEQTESRFLMEIGQLRQMVKDLEAEQSGLNQENVALKTQLQEARQSALLSQQKLENEREKSEGKDALRQTIIDQLSGQVDSLTTQLSRSFEQSAHLQEEVEKAQEAKRKVELVNVDLERRLIEATTLEIVKELVLDRTLPSSATTEMTT